MRSHGTYRVITQPALPDSGRSRPQPHAVQHLTHRGTHIPEPSLPPTAHVLGGHPRCLHTGTAKQTAAPRHGLKPHSRHFLTSNSTPVAELAHIWSKSRHIIQGCHINCKSVTSCNTWDRSTETSTQSVPLWRRWHLKWGKEVESRTFPLRQKQRVPEREIKGCRELGRESRVPGQDRKRASKVTEQPGPGA